MWCLDRIIKNSYNRDSIPKKRISCRFVRDCLNKNRNAKTEERRLCMIGIALEGGAERSAFTVGVLDQLMEYEFNASAVSGTSAGAGCALNFCSG